MNDPLSLHKYLYVHGDPVGGVDPSGEFLIGMISALAISNNQRVQDASKNRAAWETSQFLTSTIFGASGGVFIQNVYGGLSWSNSGIGVYYGAILGAGLYIAKIRDRVSEALASGVITGAMNAAFAVFRDISEYAYNPFTGKLRLNPAKEPASLVGRFDQGLWGFHDSFSTSTVGTGLQNFFQGFSIGVWNEATEVFDGGAAELGDAAVNFVDTYLNTIFAQASAGRKLNHHDALAIGLMAAATDLIQAAMPDEIPDGPRQLMAGAIVGAGLAFAEAVVEVWFETDVFDSEHRFGNPSL